jgi:tRNA pseudouridine38-40 synthase
VQDRVERALEKFLGAPVATVCAGRTDAGVHALAQVLHLDTEVDRDEVSWVRGTNTSLPPDIRVVWARQTGTDFHARFSASSRTYRYVLLNDPVEPAVLSGMVGWFHAPLDVAKMQAAAALLLGEHDFSAYRASECQAKSPVRTLTVAGVESIGSGHASQQMMVFTFRANAFLHHMVRNMIGELVYVGAGRRGLAEFRAILDARDRTRAAPTFSPDGLYLCDIEYDSRFGLPLACRRHPFPF